MKEQQQPQPKFHKTKTPHKYRAKLMNDIRSGAITQRLSKEVSAEMHKSQTQKALLDFEHKTI